MTPIQRALAFVGIIFVAAFLVTLAYVATQYTVKPTYLAMLAVDGVVQMGFLIWVLWRNGRK
jgi:ABC-type Mn2+/Zn2+ transport system permease subunit